MHGAYVGIIKWRIGLLLGGGMACRTLDGASSHLLMATDTLGVHGVSSTHQIVVFRRAGFVAFAAIVLFIAVIQVVVTRSAVQIVICGMDLVGKKYITCTSLKEHTNRFFGHFGLQHRVTKCSCRQQNQSQYYGQFPLVVWAHPKSTSSLFLAGLRWKVWARQSSGHGRAGASVCP